MIFSDGIKQIETFFIIVNYGLGSKVIKLARKLGISGGTCLLGKGTSENHLLELLGISDIRKEIVLLVGEKQIAYNALEELDKKFDFHKPNHGIAFSISVSDLIGCHNFNEYKECKDEGGESMYKAIFVIVDRGKAEAVMDAAKSAGAKGGTIINARGSGIHETQKLFAMEIEPEKEIVMILTETSITDNVTATINESMKLSEPGNGIMFVLNVNKTYGLVK
ncbi:MAG: P-II family nitrogen regulator [Clostridiaceae bacterium]|nr:P-II family nitrogen regulator [Clostridiaceae bacterium]